MFFWKKKRPSRQPAPPLIAAGYVDPETGAGFEAPPPEQAYRVAPGIAQEALELALAVVDPSGDPDVDEEQERLVLLRRAALADRVHLDHPGNERLGRDAVRLSQMLLAFDRERPHCAPVGVAGPDSPEWDPSARPYVRACYEAWGW